MSFRVLEAVRVQVSRWPYVNPQWSMCWCALALLESRGSLCVRNCHSAYRLRYSSSNFGKLRVGGLMLRAGETCDSGRHSASGCVFVSLEAFSLRLLFYSNPNTARVCVLSFCWLWRVQSLSQGWVLFINPMRQACVCSCSSLHSFVKILWITRCCMSLCFVSWNTLAGHIR